MFKYGKASLERLEGCQEDLKIIFMELIKYMDITILCGPRSQEAQEEAFKNKATQVHYPNSKHNVGPAAKRKKSAAVDSAPYPIDWKDIARFDKMNDLILKIALEKGIKIRQGRNFSFKDHPHNEVVDERN